MALQAIETVRNALRSGSPVRASDLVALCAVADQLWQQTVRASQRASADDRRRDYMREYMRHYRQLRRSRQDAIPDHNRQATVS